MVPIRVEDRYAIMKWRNEQIYHLRQDKTLTREDQDHYFTQVVSGLFEQEKPEQILFSFLKGDQCIGYGGLVHINWIDQNAEISFIMDTTLEKDHFDMNWSSYLKLIEDVAFEDLKLHKLYTYAFDIRPNLYPILENRGYFSDGILNQHCFHHGEFKDVRIHSKTNTGLTLRRARLSDIETTFAWASNAEVRKYALNKTAIDISEHCAWFAKRLNDKNCIYKIAEFNGKPVGSFRLDIDSNGGAAISYLLDPAYHSKGLGKRLLFLGKELAQQDSRVEILVGHVLIDNAASVHLFTKLGFVVKDNANRVLKFQMRMR